MKMQPMAIDQLLTPAEVAAILFVDPKTVTRWARAGKLDAIRTPGGHRRYLRSDVLAIMTGEHESQQSGHLLPGAGTVDESSAVEPTASALSEGWSETDAPAGMESSEAVAAALEAEAEEAAASVIASAAAVTAAAQKAVAAAARARAARALAADEAARRAADRAVRDALAQSAASAPWSAPSGAGEKKARGGGVATTARQSDTSTQVPTQRGS